MVVEKDKYKKVIILFSIIIIVLIIICILFATNTISFNNKENIESNNSEIKKDLTNEDAINIVKNIFTNSTVQYLVDHVSVLYCDIDIEHISEETLGLDYQWNGYNKCTNYHSYEELTNYFKQYVTEEYFSKLLVNEPYLRDKITSSDGKVIYNYYEKDGNLYVANTGKGSNMNKVKLLDNEIEYKIDSLDNNKIISTINAKWYDASDNIYEEIEKMTIVNDNGIWKVDMFETINS